MKNAMFNKIRSYPQKSYWFDTDGLMSEKYYKKGFKRQKNRTARQLLKRFVRSDYEVNGTQ